MKRISVTSQPTKQIVDVRSDIEANIGRVFRIASTIGDWPGRVEQWLGKQRWRVYDLENRQHAIKRTEDIVGLWEGDLFGRPYWSGRARGE